MLYQSIWSQIVKGKISTCSFGRMSGMYTHKCRSLQRPRSQEWLRRRESQCPVGGFAKGIPRYSETCGCHVEAWPWSIPLDVLTSWPIVQGQFWEIILAAVHDKSVRRKEPEKDNIIEYILISGRPVAVQRSLRIMGDRTNK